jgi:hypothetical protein
LFAADAVAAVAAATIYSLLCLLFVDDGSVYFTSMVKNKENINMAKKRRPFVVLHTHSLLSLSPWLFLQGYVRLWRVMNRPRRVVSFSSLSPEK